MTRVLALILLAFVPSRAPVLPEPKPCEVVRCQEIEVNTVYYWDEQKQKLGIKFHQIIGWRTYKEARIIRRGEWFRLFHGGRHVVTYHLISTDPRRVHYRFPYTHVIARCASSDERWVEYVGRYVRRTHTLNDPEMDDRQWWPLEVRDGKYEE